MILGINGIIAGRGVIPSTLSNSLVSIYKAENNANDSFGTNNGTAIGGLTYATGKSGNSFTYNGSNAYVQLPNNSLNFTTDFSISVWVNLVGVSNVEPLVNNFKQFNSNYYGYLLFVYNSNLYFRICDGVSSNVYDITTAFTSTSTWKHIVITRKRSVITKVYIDGILITSANTVNQGYESTMQYARIGGYNDLSGDRVLSNGSKVDEVGLWTKELTSTEVTELYRCGSGSFYPYISLPSLDSDACAFIGAASITDTTQQSAINQLVLDLKSANIWTKMKAIYPFVGGTASQHRFNLRNPSNGTPAFYLTFYGGGTHNSNGYNPDGATAYANTWIYPSANYSNQYSSHISIYTGTDVFPSTNGVDVIGAYSLSPTKLFQIGHYTDGSNVKNHATVLGGDTNILDSSLSIAKGFILGSRTSQNSLKLYKNNNLLQTNTNTVSNTLPDAHLYIGGRNGAGSPDVFSKLNHRFVSIGDGLSDSEATALYNAVITFNTTLGRAV